MSMDDERIVELQENFDHFDQDENGKIDLAEFIRLMDALQAMLTPDEARIGFQSVDSDGDGRIDFDEFKEWWGDR
jgi:Ca2+-binding EF-hand superfamily protein